MIINTNARSLNPKIDSLIECFNELTADIAIVTETWFREGPELDIDLHELEMGTNIKAITLNRPPNQRTGVSHGGGAFFYRKSIGGFKKIKIDNPDSFEVLPVVSSLSGTSRKLAVIAAYIPPNYAVPKGKKCLDYIESCIIDIKRHFNDPLIAMAGDFNQ